MADLPIPQEMIDWMTERDWQNHHVEWHFIRRWDFWHALAPDNPVVQAMVDNALAQGWARAALQEGEPGSGVDFLLMHRAMFHLLHRAFPQHSHFLRGWTTPPTDPAEFDDIVPLGAAFEREKSVGITILESLSATEFSSEDEWAMFLETNIRPLPDNPTNRSVDLRLGLHNYLHNRWSNQDSPINLGDPSVNIFNQRFWRLHGWIDYYWWRFRQARLLSDTDPEYKSRLDTYIQMMNATHDDPHHHLHIHRFSPADRKPASPFNQFFQF